MKYRIAMVAGIFLFVFSLPCAHAAGACKIGVVDIQKFQEKSVAFQKVKENYIKRLEPSKRNLEKEKEELEKITDELKKQSLMLSFDAKEDKRKELGKRSRHYKYLENEFLQEQKELQMELVRVVGQEIQKIVEDIGKRQGYLMILEKRAVGVLYNDDKIDITDEIIREYDRKKK